MFSFFGKSKLQKKIDIFLEKIQYLSQELEAGILELDTKAFSSIEEWEEYLQILELEPVTEEQKEQAKKRGIPLPKIAFPSEYYSALIVVLRKINIQRENIIEDSKKEEIFEEISDEIESLRYQIATYYEDKLSEYLKKSKPKLSVSGIFGNASKSLNNNTVAMKESTLYSIKCDVCGAARLEEDQCDECFYCGSPFTFNKNHND